MRGLPRRCAQPHKVRSYARRDIALETAFHSCVSFDATHAAMSLTKVEGPWCPSMWQRTGVFSEAYEFMNRVLRVSMIGSRCLVAVSARIKRPGP